VNVGSHIGQYRILRKIGVGGMGTVYLGEHILLGRRAAIKTLLPALSMQTEIVERFFTEARATSAITDHGVVQIFDFGYHVDGTAYIVMELLEGESLQTRIDRLGQISPCVALRIARQVAASLAAAHDKDIVHRDLKPENIYLIADAEAASGERTKILDFGICKLGVAGAEPALTQTGTTMGTPVYMSPEQCRGAGKVDHRSDIYALGCVLFHMVAGRPPFECEGAGEFIVAHLQEDPPTPSSFIPALPELVDGLIIRCLE
jgi:serine/threonine protein kinase